MSFSEKLQKLRKKHGLSQEGLAELLDVTRQSVSKWELGTTYPEMDKLLSMCKIFKCSLDDLTNDEITDMKFEEKKKNSLYTLIDSILYFINQTYHTCKIMTWKEIIHLVISMTIVVLILLVFRIPFSFIESVFKDGLRFIHNEFLMSLGAFIIETLIHIAYFSFFAIIFIYAFKLFCLDNEKYKNRKTSKKEAEQEAFLRAESIAEKKDFTNKKERKIETASFTLFRFLSTIVVFVGKAIVGFCTLPILILLFFLCAALFITIFLLFKGVIYISILVGIPFAILLIFIILKVFFAFLFNKKINERKSSIMFLVSIVGLGFSFGIFLLDISSISYIDAAPKAEISTFLKSYDMTDDLYFLFQDSVEYVIDDSKTGTVAIEVEYYKDFTEILLPPELYSSVPYYEKSYIFINQNLLSIMIDDLAHRRIHNYGSLNNVNIKLSTSEENIKKLKENYQKEREKMDLKNREEECKPYYYDQYQSKIEQLEQDIEDLKYKKNELEMNNENLILEIEEYQRKIEDYRKKLQAIIED